jgi:lysophospholipase L1-like esterase
MILSEKSATFRDHALDEEIGTMSRKDLALSAASIVLGLILVEIVLRIFNWSYPIFMQPDADLGWSFRPGARGWSIHESAAYVRINRFGFRGKDWADEAPRDAYRVAVIGDSFVDSSNLPEDDALTSLIEKSLDACPALADRRAEMLNFGVSGYGTAQQYLLLQRRVEPLRPNLVLLVFYLGNDVAENSPVLSTEGRRTKPYFVELPSGELRLDAGFRDSEDFRQALARDWLKRLVNASFVLQLLKQFQQDMTRKLLPAGTPVEYGSGTDKVALFPPEHPGLFVLPESEEWRKAWSVTEKLILGMRDRARERNSEFGLVVIPAPVQALPSEDMRRTAARAFGLADLDAPMNRLSRFAGRNGIAYFSLLEELRARGDGGRVFLYGFPPYLGDGHLNSLGNRASGRSISDWLCRRLQPS